MYVCAWPCSFPLIMVPNVINNIVEAQVSVSRVESFLLEPNKILVPELPLKDVGVYFNNTTLLYEGMKEKLQHKLNTLLALHEGTLEGCATSNAASTTWQKDVTSTLTKLYQQILELKNKIFVMSKNKTTKNGQNQSKNDKNDHISKDSIKSSPAHHLLSDAEFEVIIRKLQIRVYEEKLLQYTFLLRQLHNTMKKSETSNETKLGEWGEDSFLHGNVGSESNDDGVISSIASVLSSHGMAGNIDSKSGTSGSGSVLQDTYHISNYHPNLIFDKNARKLHEVINLGDGDNDTYDETEHDNAGVDGVYGGTESIGGGSNGGNIVFEAPQRKLKDYIDMLVNNEYLITCSNTNTYSNTAGNAGSNANSSNSSNASNTGERCIALNNIAVMASKGDLLCLVGKVGSGKSSILGSLIGRWHCVW